MDKATRPKASKELARQHPAWIKMRAVHLMTYPECRICERTEDAVVHHLRYRGPRGRSEKPGDLVTMCRRHHDEFHRRYGRAREIRGDLVNLTLEFIQEKRAMALETLPLS